MIPLIVIVASALVVVLGQSLRHPTARRLGLRNGLRRPGETALVIAGSLLGTALITGSFIVGDTLDSSIRATARTQLGPIDERIEVPDADRAAQVLRLIRETEDERIDGAMSLVAVTASLRSEVGPRPRSEPNAQMIELDFDDGRAFGDDPAATGLEGPTPRPGEVAITTDLAATLGVAEGDRVSAFLFRSQVDLEVVRVMPRLGLAGYWLGFESRSANAFVAPGTVEQLVPSDKKARALGLAPPSTTIVVSNAGGVEEGVDLSGEVTRLLQGSIGSDGVVFAPTEGFGFEARGLRVEQVKKARLEAADEQGSEFSELFLGIGSFAIIAGILLLVNIFVMLAEERKSQLGMLRAVGMRRIDLVRSFVIEGSIYSVLASVVGSVVGIGVGWSIATLAAPIFGGFDDFALELSFAMSPSSIVMGACIGILISLATITFTSIRISRINIISAIRDLPERRRGQARTRTAIAGVVIAAAGASWFAGSLGDDAAWASAMLGPTLVAFGTLPLTTRLVGRRAAVMLAASAVLFWGVFGNSILGNRFFEAGEIFAFVLQGILLTFSAVILLSQMQENFEGVIRRVAARNLPLRLGIAYPLARRFRTGLTLGMYALVIFTMTFIAVLAHIFGGQVDTFAKEGSGDFDVVVTSSATNPPDVRDIESIEGVQNVATLTYGIALFRPDGYGDADPWPATGIDETFVAVGPPKIEEIAPEYADEGDVWRALLSDPEVVVVPDFFLQMGGGPPVALVKPGDTMAMVDPITGAITRRRIIGILASDISFSGVHMSAESLRQVMGDRASPSHFFVQTEGGEADARQIGAEMQGTLFANGVEADTFLSLVEQFQALNLQFFRLMQGYLALGLTVGIAGLGVVMVRSVRERRREIGVLRSVGFLPTQVRKAFLLESGFTALQGILVGSALAMVTAAQLIGSGEFGATAVFSIPWDQVGVLWVGAMLASLLATVWPAQQASGIPPAVALRIAD